MSQYIKIRLFNARIASGARSGEGRGNWVAVKGSPFEQAKTNDHIQFYYSPTISGQKLELEAQEKPFKQGSTVELTLAVTVNGFQPAMPAKGNWPAREAQFAQLNLSIEAVKVIEEGLGEAALFVRQPKVAQDIVLGDKKQAPAQQMTQAILQ